MYGRVRVAKCLAQGNIRVNTGDTIGMALIDGTSFVGKVKTITDRTVIVEVVQGVEFIERSVYLRTMVGNVVSLSISNILEIAM